MRLTLTKVLLSAIEKELGKLRDEEIVPYLMMLFKQCLMAFLVR